MAIPVGSMEVCCELGSVKSRGAEAVLTKLISFADEGFKSLIGNISIWVTAREESLGRGEKGLFKTGESFLFGRGRQKIR